jgi:hypothetical protein
VFAELGGRGGNNPTSQQALGCTTRRKAWSSRSGSQEKEHVVDGAMQGTLSFEYAVW